MDTQSKKLRYSFSFKIIAWVLSVAGMCAAGWGFLESYANGWADIHQSYAESSEYKSFLQDGAQNVFYAFYMNENSMQGEIKSETDRLNAERENKILSLNSEGKSPDNTAQLIAAINQLYDSQIEGAKNAIINEYERMHTESEAKLADRKDLIYAVDINGVIIKTNIQEPDPIGYIKNLNYSQSTFSQTVEKEAQPSPAVGVDQTDPVTVYTAMPKEVFVQKESQYQIKVSDNRIISLWIICGLAAFAAGFVWLLLLAGKRPDGGEIVLQWSDAIPLDVGFVLLCIAEALCLMALSTPTLHSANTFPENLYNFTFIAIGVSAWNVWFVSLAKRIRLKKAAKYTAVYMLFGSLHRLYKESGAAAKTVWLALLWILGIFVGTGFFVGGFYIHVPAPSVVGFILIITLAALILRFLLKKAAAVKKITDGLARMQQGELDYAIQPSGGRELDAIADGINHVADGFNAAVGKEVKAERMKTELITNISHDLRTPLTSIITYIDLLKKEELPGENAAKYIEVLDEKSRKLKVLTDDLFEAAKAASGDISVNMSRIELVQFMQQALGELSDRIQSSGLIFITDIPSDNMYICADGKLLWRVFGNVLDNVFKYALSGSRVYIDVKRKANNICITVKNISKEPLNIPAEELMERFRRGDASRHTDGSGLGLAIAKDLMRIMNCGFEIETDGDLFKVSMNFKESNS